MVEIRQAEKVLKRAALYLDGFNLYHAINDLDDNFLKWCNLWRLAESIIPSGDEKVVRVVFCTAFYPGDFGRRVRHERYIKALTLVGVDTVMGHYVHEDMDCRKCKHEWEKPTEKETDINVALSLYDDAARDVIDHAYLLTADSDQAATARLFRQRFPAKKLITVSPPGRAHSQDILRYAGGKVALNKEHIERALFGLTVEVGRAPIVLRPKEYAPPQGYVPFDKRPG